MHAVSFSPDGKTLATCAGQGTVCLWEDRTWKPLCKFQAGGITPSESPGSSTLGWAPDGASLAVLRKEDTVLLILNPQSGQVLRELEGNSQEISTIAWSPDGGLLALGTADGMVKLWDIASGSNEEPIVVIEHADRVSSIVWTPDSERVIIGGADGVVRVCETEQIDSSDIIARYPNAINCLSVSPDGKKIAFGSVDNVIRICEVDGTAGTVSLSEPNDTTDIQLTAVAWSPDGSLLASGYSRGVVRIWDNESRRSIHEIDADCGSVDALTWSHDGQVLVGGGNDGTGRIWNVRDDFEDCVVLLPLWGSPGPGMAIARGGDYRGPPGISDNIVYVVNSADGQTTLRPAEFESHHGWVNESWQVGLHRSGSETVGRIYVRADANGPDPNGTSWNTAFNRLEEALSVAEPNTEIWVARGTYRPTRGNGRSLSFRLKKGVKLLGGFSGREIDIDQRDPDKNETILSGDLKGNDIPVSDPQLLLNEPTRADNSYHVVLASEVDSGTVLDGFIITGGNANGPGPKRIENVHQHGAGCFVADGSGLTLIDCTIGFNASLTEGGGIYTERGRIILQNCTFVSNRASNGGAISARHGKSTAINCAFTKNSAISGGAVSTTADNSRFADCIFTENSGQSGGAVYAVYPEGNAIFTNCRFFRNSASYGGGAYIFQSSPKFTNCLFNFNLGCGICNRDGSSPELVNCTIVGNRSRFPGCGIHSFDSEAEATCIPVLVNCIVWHNIDETSTAESEQIHGGSPVVNNCCIQGWNDELGGTGNFGDSPLFIDPDGSDDRIGTEDDDFRLSPNSRCINTGDDSMLPKDTLDLDRDGDLDEPIPFDIEGKSRILGGKVDLGAYESG